MIGASELIEQTIKLYRTHFRTLLTNVIWIFAVVAGAQILLGLLLERSGIKPISALGAIVFAIFIFIQLALTIILIAASDRLAANGQTRLDELTKIVRSRFFPALGVYVAVGAMIILVASVAALGFIIASRSPMNGENIEQFARFSPFLAVVGIIAAVISLFFSFSAPEIILHGGTVKHALLTSLGLIRRRFWRIAWRLFAPTLFFGVAVSLASTLLGYAAKGTARDITDGLLNALAAPLLIIPLILLYHDLRKV